MSDFQTIHDPSRSVLIGIFSLYVLMMIPFVAAAFAFGCCINKTMRRNRLKEQEEELDRRERGHTNWSLLRKKQRAVSLFKGTKIQRAQRVRRLSKKMHSLRRNSSSKGMEMTQMTPIANPLEDVEAPVVVNMQRNEQEDQGGEGEVKIEINDPESDAAIIQESNHEKSADVLASKDTRSAAAIKRRNSVQTINQLRRRNSNRGVSISLPLSNPVGAEHRENSREERETKYAVVEVEVEVEVEDKRENTETNKGKINNKGKKGEKRGKQRRGRMQMKKNELKNSVPNKDPIRSTPMPNVVESPQGEQKNSVRTTVRNSSMPGPPPSLPGPPPIPKPERATKLMSLTEINQQRIDNETKLKQHFKTNELKNKVSTPDVVVWWPPNISPFSYVGIQFVCPLGFSDQKKLSLNLRGIQSNEWDGELDLNKDGRFCDNGQNVIVKVPLARHLYAKQVLFVLKLSLTAEDVKKRRHVLDSMDMSIVSNAKTRDQLHQWYVNAFGRNSLPPEQNKKLSSIITELIGLSDQVKEGLECFETKYKVCMQRVKPSHRMKNCYVKLTKADLSKIGFNDNHLEAAKQVEQPTTPSPSVIPTPSKTISGEVNQQDGYEYLESPPGTEIWFSRENSTSEWTRWEAAHQPQKVQKTVEITIPNGAHPGDKFKINLPDGRQMQVTVPFRRQGDKMTVNCASLYSFFPFFFKQIKY